MSQSSKTIRKKSSKGGRRIAENAIRDEHGEVLVVHDVTTGTKYTDLFFADPKEYTGGFRKYLTQNGPSNKKVIKDLPVQGLTKTALACIRHLCDLVADGNPEATKAIEIFHDYIPAQLKRSGQDGIARRRAEIQQLQRLGANMPQ